MHLLWQLYTRVTHKILPLNKANKNYKTLLYLIFFYEQEIFFDLDKNCYYSYYHLIHSLLHFFHFQSWPGYSSEPSYVVPSYTRPSTEGLLFLQVPLYAPFRCGNNFTDVLQPSVPTDPIMFSASNYLNLLVILNIVFQPSSISFPSQSVKARSFASKQVLQITFSCSH